jgi:hypothetical protein
VMNARSESLVDSGPNPWQNECPVLFADFESWERSGAVDSKELVASAGFGRWPMAEDGTIT